MSAELKSVKKWVNEKIQRREIFFFILIKNVRDIEKLDGQEEKLEMKESPSGSERLIIFWIFKRLF